MPLPGREDPENDGWRAGYAGESAGACPHACLSHQALAWTRGWERGRLSREAFWRGLLEHRRRRSTSLAQKSALDRELRRLVPHCDIPPR